MIIKKIKFKNIGSYGNKIQELNFDNSSGLILLTGNNGAGKSTIQNAIDVCIFNTGRGKNQSKIPLKDFPNRNNKNLYVNVEFINQNGDNISIKKYISPNNFNITVNEQDYTERFKLMTEIQKEQLIGFNYQTFKSFISLSMNDFLNFINLKPEDKRNLLNRLFNLDDIDKYFSITKELIIQNKKEIENLSLNIINIDNELKEYKNIILKYNNSMLISENDFNDKLIQLKQRIDTIEYDNNIYNNKKSEYKVLIQENKNNINIHENDNIVKRTELNELRKKIKIYETGKCPMCENLLIDDKHNFSLNEMILKDSDITKIIELNNNIIFDLKTKNVDYYREISIIDEIIINNENILMDLKSENSLLKKQIDNNQEQNNIIIEDIKKLGIDAKKNKETKINRINFLKKENIQLKELLLIFDENGLRKKIISSIIPNINNIMSYLLNKINFPYIVKLNNNFDVDIYDRNEIINSEVLSNGEIRMLNICVAISYIEIVRKHKNINLLFMDEVFQSVHKDNINLLLILLKDFSERNNINLILVHHGLEDFDFSYFSKIIRVEKKMFSDITILN